MIYYKAKKKNYLKNEYREYSIKKFENKIKLKV
jgi:hypothetical protein